MRTAGYILIAVGFLGGTLVAVQTKANQIEWFWFTLCMVTGGVGVVAARLGLRSQARHAGALATHSANLRTSLRHIVHNIRQIDATKQDEPVHAVHRRIDELFAQHLAGFVAARQSLMHIYGLKAYADVMSDFAAGERYLNRAWSASVDGYIDEVSESLARAKEQFEQTQDRLEGLAS